MKTIIKERPIPFSEDMVLAVLAGRNTQTSRTRGLERFNGWPDWKIPLGEDAWELCYFTEEEPGIWRAVFLDPRGECPPGLDPVVKCPYGKTGDRLWVRESWQVHKIIPWAGIRVKYLADDGEADCMQFPQHIFDRLVDQSFEDYQEKGVWPWSDSSVPRRRPPMFMPRAASRIFLEITDIKLKRLKSIDWREAEAEGIEPIFYDEETSVTGWKNYLDPERMCVRARDSFFTLWDRINGAGAAEKDPWVWMIKFKVLEVKRTIK